MSELLEALRTRQPLPAPAVSKHAAETGCCQVELGDDLTVLAYYEACMVGAEEHIEVTDISINGHTVPAYMIARDVVEAWAGQISAERADDARSSREAAEYAAWEATQ